VACVLDERSFSWRVLLPAQSTFRLQHAPAELSVFLARSVHPKGDVYLSWHATDAALPSSSPAYALALVNPRRVSRRRLRQLGFRHVRAFAALPSFDDARWFIPIDSRRGATRAWDLYPGFRADAVIRRAVAKTLSRTGAARFAGDRVILAQRHVPPLERMVSEALGVRRLNVALASGTLGARRKVTAQFTAGDSWPVAYAKCADGREAAAASVRAETKLLDHVQALPLRSLSAPRVLARSVDSRFATLVSTPVSASPPPHRLCLTRLHLAALADLASHSQGRPMRDWLVALNGRISQTPFASCQHRQQQHQLFKRAVTAMESVPDLSLLPTALSHGDFVPWNVRFDRRSGRLAVIDWENGHVERPLLWDAFHFLTQVQVLVRRKLNRSTVLALLSEIEQSALARSFRLSTSQLKALYLAYLVDSSLQMADERPCASDGHDWEAEARLLALEILLPGT